MDKELKNKEGKLEFLDSDGSMNTPKMSCDMSHRGLTNINSSQWNNFEWDEELSNSNDSETSCILANNEENVNNNKFCDDNDQMQDRLVVKCSSIESAQQAENLSAAIDCNNPFQLYRLFLTDELVNQMVSDSNRHAEEYQSNAMAGHKSNNQVWMAVSCDEMFKFIGILFVMAVVHVPEIRLYWSNKSMYTNLLIKKSMGRNRFLKILKHWHFVDNSQSANEDRLMQMQSVLNGINRRFHDTLKPRKDIVLDESTVSWCGQLMFRQYMPELICGTMLVNAWIIHRKWGNNKISILQFREAIIHELLKDTAPLEIIPSSSKLHFIKVYDGPAKNVRKRCRECYKAMSKDKGREEAVTKVKRIRTYCPSCEGQPPLCMKCFEIVHTRQ